MSFLYRQFTTQAQIDAQYNAGAAVPDYAAYLARYQSSSAATREAIPCILNVPYGPTRAETLDIFPAENPGAPVLVFLHGGYWRALSASDFSFVARGPRQHGLTTVVVNYDLCPWVTIDEVVRQIRAGLAWVYRHIGEHGADPQRIIVSGHSAGGQLTAMSLLTPWADRYGLPDDLVKVALPISGLYDLAPLRYSYLQPALQLDEGLVARNSALLQPQVRRLPVMVAWGEQESDEFVRQSHAYAQCLADAGCQVERHASAGAHHFSVLDEFEEPGSRMCLWLSQVFP